MEEREITVDFDDSVVEQIARTADSDYGARPLRRRIQTEIEDLLAEQLLTGQIRPGDRAALQTRRKRRRNLQDRFHFRFRCAMIVGAEISPSIRSQGGIS